MSRLPESLSAAAPPVAAEAYSSQERASLLAIARQSIQAKLTGTRSVPEPVTARLAEPRGVFVTLYLAGALRGCIGYPFPTEPLHRATADAAVNAALRDPRFPPVGPDELPRIRISLSVLSPMFDISAEQIEVGRHGLMVTLGGSRGLLLPQVAVEHQWNARQFLENTCIKAGLPIDAWRFGAHLQAFTAEVFGEEQVHRATETQR